MGFVSPAEEAADVELLPERGGQPGGRQRGSAQGCEAELLSCGTEEMAGTGKWPEFGWGASGTRGGEREDPGDGAILLGLISLEAASTCVVLIKQRDQGIKGLSGWIITGSIYERFY